MRLTLGKYLVNAMIIFVFSLVFSTQNSEAYDVNGDKTSSYVLYFHKLCGDMTEDILKSGGANETDYKFYITGVMDTVNAMACGKINYFEQSNPDANFLFVKKYCEENPLDLLSQAVDKMVEKNTGKNLYLLSRESASNNCPSIINNNRN